VPRTNIQIFACPACSKLYKRKVDIWIDFQNPRPPSSPGEGIPRVCQCGRVFSLSESTVIANLSPSDRPGARRAAKDALTEDVMDRLDIPAFLRKQATGDDEEIPLTESRPKRAPRKPGLFSRLIKKTTSLVQFKREPRKKTEVVKDVLWQMEEIALPEKIAPRSRGS